VGDVGNSVAVDAIEELATDGVFAKGGCDLAGALQAVIAIAHNTPSTAIRCCFNQMHKEKFIIDKYLPFLFLFNKCLFLISYSRLALEHQHN
jgi:hypothetical protein